VSFSDEVVEIPSHTLPLSADAASGSDFDYVKSASEGEDWSSESSDENDAEMWEQILDGTYCSAVPPKMDPGFPAAVGQRSCGRPRRCVPKVLCVFLCRLMTLWQALLYVQKGKVSVD